jgi:hypothetical protein
VVPRLDAGQSCDEVCAANCGMKCDATQLAAVDTADKFETTVAPFISCAKPYLVRCGREGVTSSDDGLCYYHGAAACSALSACRSRRRRARFKPAANTPDGRVPHLPVHWRRRRARSRHARRCHRWRRRAAP